jgi:hypothetical protein
MSRGIYLDLFARVAKRAGCSKLLDVLTKVIVVADWAAARSCGPLVADFLLHFQIRYWSSKRKFMRMEHLDASPHVLDAGLAP